MKFFQSHSLSRLLAFLVILAVLPALGLLLYSGMEYQQYCIREAEGKILQITQTMTQANQEFANSTKQILSTLALLPAIQATKIPECNKIFSDILKQNPLYHNISLADLNGNVIASGQPLKKTNTLDRKHIRDAIKTNAFTAGEYIISRIGSNVSAFAFSYPIEDDAGHPEAILSAVIDLNRFSAIYSQLDLPEKSFIAITDYKGIRLFYYPTQSLTNPIGKPIKAESWDIASTARNAQVFRSEGSDGLERVFACEPVYLGSAKEPYMYVWAAIPEIHIVGPVNATIVRNIFLMLVAATISLVIALIVGRKTELLINSLEEASTEIKTLSGLLPICSGCKKIRDDNGYWNQLESYISKHTEANFSHGMCPDCLQKYYGHEPWYNKDQSRMEQ